MERMSDEKLADIRATIEGGKVPTVSANAYLKLLLDELTAERAAYDGLLEDIKDPRNTRWTDGFCDGLDFHDFECETYRAALVWLCREQAVLTGDPDNAEAIFDEAYKVGEELTRERRAEGKR
jgi:hypothetical protein